MVTPVNIVFVLASYGHKAKLCHFPRPSRGQRKQAPYNVKKKYIIWHVLHYRTSKQSQALGRILYGVCPH